MKTTKKKQTQWAETVETIVVLCAFLITFIIGLSWGGNEDNHVVVEASCDGVEINYTTISNYVKLDC